MIWATSSAFAHIGVLYNATPDDWCDTLALTIGGDIVLLAPGDYVGPCTVPGTVNPVYPGDFTAVQAEDPFNQPRMLWDGASDHILDVTGTHVLVGLMTFPDVPAGVTGIRVRDGDTLWTRYLTFEQVAGTAIAYPSDVGDGRVSEVAVLGGGGTGIDIACSGCAAEVSYNLLLGLGTGARFGVGASGWLHDNIVGEGATALVFDGGAAASTTIEQNLWAGDVGARVAGPALVRNNYLVGGVLGVDVGSGVTLTGNTVASPMAWQVAPGSEVRNNAVDGPLTPVEPGTDGGGNVGCESGCFVDPVGWDWYPLTDWEGVADPELTGDYCGHARGETPTSGAMERIGPVGVGPLTLVSKWDFDCRYDEEPTGTVPGGTTEPVPTVPDDTGLPWDSGQIREPKGDGDKGCGCGGGAAGAGLALLALHSLRRRPSRVRS